MENDLLGLVENQDPLKFQLTVCTPCFHIKNF